VKQLKKNAVTAKTPLPGGASYLLCGADVDYR
jgi:hypothetical protein